MLKLERVKKLCSHPEKITIFPLDLSNPREVIERTNRFVNENNKQIDILINNGGISMRSGFMENSFENEMTIINVNYLSQIAITKVIYISYNA